jgi:hypothetical protein
MHGLVQLRRTNVLQRRKVGRQVFIDRCRVPRGSLEARTPAFPVKDVMSYLNVDNSCTGVRQLFSFGQQLSLPRRNELRSVPLVSLGHRATILQCAAGSVPSLTIAPVSSTFSRAPSLFDRRFAKYCQDSLATGTGLVRETAVTRPTKSSAA